MHEVDEEEASISMNDFEIWNIFTHFGSASCSIAFEKVREMQVFYFFSPASNTGINSSSSPCRPRLSRRGSKLKNTKVNVEERKINNNDVLTRSTVQESSLDVNTNSGDICNPSQCGARYDHHHHHRHHSVIEEDLNTTVVVVNGLNTLTSHLSTSGMKSSSSHNGSSLNQRSAVSTYDNPVSNDARLSCLSRDSSAAMGNGGHSGILSSVVSYCSAGGGDPLHMSDSSDILPFNTADFHRRNMKKATIRNDTQSSSVSTSHSVSTEGAIIYQDLRKAFDAQALLEDIRFDVVIPIIFHVFLAYRSLLDSFATAERMSIFSRLTAVLGLPKKYQWEHLAVRCTLIFIRDIKIDPSLMSSVQAGAASDTVRNNISSCQEGWNANIPDPKAISLATKRELTNLILGSTQQPIKRAPRRKHLSDATLFFSSKQQSSTSDNCKHNIHLSDSGYVTNVIPSLHSNSSET
eukprot:Tbor_TRINITY_DN5987_c0_g1::TRINITY_DN5987_c0_g1_i1::g.18369::m.18369